jgi:hypothetical protein
VSWGTESLDPRFRPWVEWLLAVMYGVGWHPLINSARRTYQQQAVLYRRYLAGLSRYPAAPPGSSMHEYGLAVDLGGLSDDQLRAAGTLWNRVGGHWGQSDNIHFEA